MKYMSFNSSCAFAGVANMLQQLGIDVQDRDIALGMKLPYLFVKEDDAYLSGPMLQSACWFNLYLNPLGYAMVETPVHRETVPAFLRKKSLAMMGLRISPREKHAVIFLGMDGETFLLRNNKWENSDEPELLRLTRQELLARLDEQVMIGHLEQSPRIVPDFQPLLRQSCAVLAQLKDSIGAFCATEKTPAEMMAATNTLFRPILLDGITMLDLIGQDDLAQQLRVAQSAFLKTVRAGQTAVLAQVLDMTAIENAMDAYIGLIQSQLFFEQ